MKHYRLTPVPKPRQTQADRWKKRPAVLRYRAFCDEVRALGIQLRPTGDRVIFILPMPKSWPKKKRAEMNGQPHQGKPDADNMLKALWDAVHQEDKHIFHADALKFWGEEGAIIIEPVRQAVAFDGTQVVWAA
jgi:Holliday junction resolvase RusA-like endonuclease